ncbi:MAG TPA: YceI family protein [Terriglobales bacterium]|nr:YceI family protein [Terriglobales bacterium]
MRKFLSVVTFALLGSSFLFADTYNLDKAHTQISFTVSHLVISHVSGGFRDFNGTINYDPADVSKSSVDVHIVASSINTGEEKRDGHLKSPDFFDVQKFPELTFKSTKVEKKGDGFVAYGPLTIHGVTKDVELPFTIAGTIKDGMGKTHLVAESSLTINRKDYGLTWNRAVEGGGVLVGEEVKIDLSVEAVK